MKGNKPVGREVQAPHNDPDEISSRKQHALAIFEWLNCLAADKNVSSAAFRVGYIISQCVNRKTGEAFPSTDTIATRAGMVQSTVREAIKLLHDLGYLGVIWGSRGRGHPNTYRMVTKERTIAVLEPTKERTIAVLDEGAKERFGRVKGRSDDVKGRTVAMNHLLTTITTERATTSPRLVDRGNLTEQEVDETRERAFGALVRVYPGNDSGTDTREVFDRLIDEGVDPDRLIIAADKYAFEKRCGAGGETIQPFGDWLKNYHQRASSIDHPRQKNLHAGFLQRRAAQMPARRQIG
jgi:Helix-turn-helix domain